MEEEEDIAGVKKTKIFVRILPVTRVCDCLMKIGDDKKELYVRCAQDMKRVHNFVKTECPVYWRFRTDGIFHNSSQEEVYEEVIKDLLSNILDGANCVIVCYGQTGTGKSFTAAGLRNSFEHRGIIARLLSDMFEEKRSKKYSNEIQYRLSYVEIYLNKINDLLSVKNNDKKDQLKSRDGIKNVTSVIIKNEDEALRKIFEGEARKKIETGDGYDASHRGTSILTFHVSNRSLITSWAVKTHSKLHIVDMAGVDSVGKTNCQKSAEQVRYANLDKTQMEQFIINLQKSNKLVTKRQSNNLLNYLSGEFNLGSLLRFIAHIRPTKEDLVLTLSVLRFSVNVKKLKATKIRRDIFELEGSLELKKLREDVAALKNELEINQILLNQEPSENISADRAKQIERDAVDFINGGLDDLTLISIAQSKILLETFKKMFKKLEQEKKTALEQTARDAYDLVARDVKHSTSSVAKLSKTAITSSRSVKMKRNKSGAAVDRLPKAVTSQVSLGFDYDEESTAKQKVGELIDSGITVGPGRLEPPFGPAVKWINVNAYGERQTVETRIPSSISTDRFGILPKITADKDDALRLFLNENEEARILKRDFEEKITARRTGQETVKELLSKCKKIKTELDLSRLELQKQQNARRLTGNEVYDDQGRVIIDESERHWFGVVKCIEDDFGNVECEIRRAEDRLKQSLNEEYNALHKFEIAFQIFSDKLPDDSSVPAIMPRENLSESNDDNQAVSIEPTDYTEQMKLKFIELQEKMKLTIEVIFSNYQTAVLLRKRSTGQLFKKKRKKKKKEKNSHPGVTA